MTKDKSSVIRGSISILIIIAVALSSIIYIFQDGRDINEIIWSTCFLIVSVAFSLVAIVKWFADSNRASRLHVSKSVQLYVVSILLGILSQSWYRDASREVAYGGYQQYSNLRVYAAIFAILCFISALSFLINELFKKRRSSAQPEKRDKRTVSSGNRVIIATGILAIANFLYFNYASWAGSGYVEMNIITEIIMYSIGIASSIIGAILSIVSAFKLKNIGLKILFIFITLENFTITGWLFMGLSFVGYGQ